MQPGSPEVTRTSPKQNFAPQAQTEFVNWIVQVQVTQRNEQMRTASVALGPVGERGSRGKQVDMTCMFSLYRKISACLVRKSMTMARTITLLRFKVSTCFKHYLPIIRRHYTNAAMMTNCNCNTCPMCDTWQVLELHSATKAALASNAQNMSRLWTSIKWYWKWSVYQVGCVYYVIK
jgi:hypothetical protein